MRLVNRDRVLADRVLAALGMIVGYSFEHERECERIMNLGIPLARMISHDLVDKISHKGRSYLEDAADDLEDVVAFSKGNPHSSVRDMWGYLDRARRARADRD